MNDKKKKGYCPFDEESLDMCLALAAVPVSPFMCTVHTEIVADDKDDVSIFR